MDEKLKTQKYLKLCQKHWQWILDNYDRLTEEGPVAMLDLKGAYFDEYDLDEPESGCYLCELTHSNCLECPLSGIAWRKDDNYLCVHDPNSVYLEITRHFEASRYGEAKVAIKKFLSIIDKECR